MSQIHLLGIRHHGPGSARNVRAHLEALQPDCLLIELPEQCTPLLSDVKNSDLQPPLAVLLYNPKNLQEASFYPFTSYSPEWQALQYAATKSITVRAIDLPFLFSPSANAQKPTSALFPLLDQNDESAVDPFQQIAELDGFSDHERWWEARIERQSAHIADTFHTIGELMEVLRSSKTTPETTDTLLREAHMRQCIRQAQKEGFKQIAIVCGAWHVPALMHLKLHTASADATILKAGKKTKVETTWIPWSYERMTLQSGYLAGVRTPMWYQYLHDKGPEKALQYWLAEAAQTLRQQDLPVSSAHIIEAIRLADTLSALRNTAVPGIEELSEATISVLCNGNAALFESIRQKLIVGDVIGNVPDKLNKSPLKTDFASRVSSARMKLTSVSTQLTLDLREAPHLKKSVLLYQMQLLEIPWGQSHDVDARQRKGGWHEDWLLCWQPEYEIQLIEKAIYGSTIQQAAENRAVETAQNCTNLSQAIGLLSMVLKADLPNVLPLILTQIRQLSAGTTDTFMLAEVAYPLAEIIRYGSARAFDPVQLTLVLDDVLTRVFIQLPGACIGLDEETATDSTKTLLKLNRAIHLPGQEQHKADWKACLFALTQQSLTASACQGLAFRLLFDQQFLQVEEVANALMRTVSIGQDPYEAALWLEGFLQGNALLILHHPPFFEILHTWLTQLHDTSFERSLPVLRRAFSAFSEPERQQIMRNVLLHEAPDIPPTTTLYDKSTDALIELSEFREQNAWLF
jgi:hypothetical protein